jgi:hypothetical protein
MFIFGILNHLAITSMFIEKLYLSFESYKLKKIINKIVIYFSKGF